MTRRRFTAVVVVLIAAAAVAVERTSEPPSGRTEVLGSTKERAPVIDAACDLDGVTVDYEVGFRSSAPAGYGIARATVGGVAPTCTGATVSVRLMAGSTELASGSSTANGSSVAVAFASKPSARAVNSVAVQVAGGTVPLPPACSSMGFDRYTSLTNDPDTNGGSKDRDLVYGRGAADVLHGDNQSDCLDGQTGNDQLFGDNHDDVLLGGDGDDVLTGGSGDDRLDGGAGFDRCIGGTGKNTFVDCEVQQ